jgi:hypothetical protein
LGIKASKHAKLRLHQRAGVPKGGADIITRNAWQKGVQHSELRGDLKKWVDGNVMKSKGIVRIHARKLFIFTGKGRLITVLNIPDELIPELKLFLWRREEVLLAKREHRKPRVDWD